MAGTTGLGTSPPGLISRKLLIPRFDNSDKTDRSAEVRYTAGTRRGHEDATGAKETAEKFLRSQNSALPF